ncbi:MAG: hypothetical protein LBI69_02450, partial [Puniceicoccales bacterium]|nr:hypothetical protein [Puniceicoccales bacterium]
TPSLGAGLKIPFHRAHCSAEPLCGREFHKIFDCFTGGCPRSAIILRCPAVSMECGRRRG